MSEGVVVEVLDEDGAQEARDGVGRSPAGASLVVVVGARLFQRREVEERLQFDEEMVWVAGQEPVVDVLAEPEEEGGEILVKKESNGLENFGYTGSVLQGMMWFL